MDRAPRGVQKDTSNIRQRAGSTAAGPGQTATGRGLLRGRGRGRGRGRLQAGGYLNFVDTAAARRDAFNKLPALGRQGNPLSLVQGQRKDRDNYDDQSTLRRQVNALSQFASGINKLKLQQQQRTAQEDDHPLARSEICASEYSEGRQQHQISSFHSPENHPSATRATSAPAIEFAGSLRPLPSSTSSSARPLNKFSKLTLQTSAVAFPTSAPGPNLSTHISADIIGDHDTSGGGGGGGDVGDAISALRLRTLRLGSPVEAAAVSPAGFAGRSLLRKIASERTQAQALRFGAVAANSKPIEGQAGLQGALRQEVGAAVPNDVREDTHQRDGRLGGGAEKDVADTSGSPDTRTVTSELLDVPKAAGQDPQLFPSNVEGLPAAAEHESASPSVGSRKLLPAMNPVMQVMEVVVGVSAERAAHALAQCRWNVEAAIELLANIEAKFSTQSASSVSLEIEPRSPSDVVTSDANVDSSVGLHGAASTHDEGQTRDSAADVNTAHVSLIERAEQGDEESHVPVKQTKESESKPVETAGLGPADSPAGIAFTGLRTDVLAQKFGPEDSVHGLAVGVTVCKFSKRGGSAELPRSGYTAPMPGLLEIGFFCGLPVDASSLPMSASTPGSQTSATRSKSPNSMAAQAAKARAILRHSGSPIHSINNEEESETDLHSSAKLGLLHGKTLLLKVTKNGAVIRHLLQHTHLQRIRRSAAAGAAAASAATHQRAKSDDNKPKDPCTEPDTEKGCPTTSNWSQTDLAQPMSLRHLQSGVYEIKKLSPLNDSHGHFALLLDVDEGDYIAWEWTVADGREVVFKVLFQPDSARTIEKLSKNVLLIENKLVNTQKALAVASRGRREAERLVQEMQSHREAVLESLLAGAAPRMREKSTKLSLVQNGCATIFLGERQEELLRRSAQLLERARWEQPHDDKLSRSQTLTSNTQIAGTKHVFDAGLQRSEYVALRTEFEKLQSDLAASQAESQVSRKQGLVQRQRLAALNRDVGALQIALGEHRQQIITLQQSVDRGAKETSELRRAAVKHQEIVQENTELCQKQTAQKELLRENRRRVAQLTATVFDLRKETATLSGSLRLEAEATAKFRKEAAEKTTKCNDLMAQIANLEKHFSDMQARVMGLEAAHAGSASSSFWELKKRLRKVDLLFALDSASDVGKDVAPNVRRGASFALAFHTQENEAEEGSGQDPAQILKDIAGHAKVLLVERATHVAEVKILREAVEELRRTVQRGKQVTEDLKRQSTTQKTDLVACNAKLATAEAQLKSSKETAKERSIAARKREAALRDELVAAQAALEESRAARLRAEETASQVAASREGDLQALQNEKDAATQLRVHNSELKAALAELYRTQSRMQSLLRVYKRQISRRNYLALYELATQGNWQAVFDRLAEFPNSVYFKHPLTGDTLLHLAAASANEKAILFLIRYNASKTVTNAHGETPHMVVGRGVDLVAGAKAAGSQNTSQSGIEDTALRDAGSSSHIANGNTGRILQRRTSATILKDLLEEENQATGDPSSGQNTVLDATTKDSSPLSRVGAGILSKKRTLEGLSSAARRVLRCAKILRPFRDAWTCKICYEGRIDTVILPCGHLVACKDCGERLTDQTCPICKQAIQRVNLVYLPDA